MQGQVDELSTLARRQGSVIDLLERRILMLEDALQRERCGAGRSGASDAVASGQAAPSYSSSGLGSGRAASGTPPSPLKLPVTEHACRKQ